MSSDKVLVNDKHQAPSEQVNDHAVQQALTLLNEKQLNKAPQTSEHVPNTTIQGVDKNDADGNSQSKLIEKLADKLGKNSAGSIGEKLGEAAGKSLSEEAKEVGKGAGEAAGNALGEAAKKIGEAAGNGKHEYGKELRDFTPKDKDNETFACVAKINPRDKDNHKPGDGTFACVAKVPHDKNEKPGDGTFACVAKVPHDKLPNGKVPDLTPPSGKGPELKPPSHDKLPELIPPSQGKMPDFDPDRLYKGGHGMQPKADNMYKAQKW